MSDNGTQNERRTANATGTVIKNAVNAASTPPQDSAPGRRLPIYILVDVSDSMLAAPGDNNSPIDSLNTALSKLAEVLKKNPVSGLDTYIGIIPFGKNVYHHPNQNPSKKDELLKVNEQFVLNQLRTEELPDDQGGTNLEAALHHLCTRMNNEVTPRVKNHVKGDYSPVVFILTDAWKIDDDWQEGLRAVADNRPTTPLFVAVFGVFNCNPKLIEAIGTQAKARFGARVENVANKKLGLPPMEWSVYLEDKQGFGQENYFQPFILAVTLSINLSSPHAAPQDANDFYRDTGGWHIATG